MSDPLPPEENPILKAYDSFVRETPLVTRWLFQTQAVTWILSFFIDLPLALGNIPQFTLFKLEVYRLVLGPFLCTSLLSLLLVYLSFLDLAKRMEHSMGSTAFGLLLGTMGVMVNVSHLVVCLILNGLTASPTWLFLPCYGIWILVFGCTSMECAGASPSSTRLLFFVRVPTPYYPMALLLLFSLLGGFQLGYLLAIGVGIAYHRGYMDRFKVDNTKIQQWERTVLENYASRPGWVANDNPGRGDWTETESSSNSGGGIDIWSRLVQRDQGPASASSTHDDSLSSGDPRAGSIIHTGSTTSRWDASSFPTSGGRPLGTASRRATPTDPRQARLEALDRRLGTSNTTSSNDDKV